MPSVNPRSSGSVGFLLSGGGVFLDGEDFRKAETDAIRAQCERSQFAGLLTAFDGFSAEVPAISELFSAQESLRLIRRIVLHTGDVPSRVQTF